MSVDAPEKNEYPKASSEIFDIGNNFPQLKYFHFFFRKLRRQHISISINYKYRILLLIIYLFLCNKHSQEL